MTTIYNDVPLSTLKTFAALKGLKISYHPATGTGFTDRDGNIVGWTTTDRREIARFIDTYRTGKPFYGIAHAALSLEAQASRLVLAAELLESMEAALKEYDVEIHCVRSGRYMVRLWHDGGMVAEVESTEELGGLLYRTLEVAKGE